ncbi:MAG: hypothetical protein WEB60_02340 [Terrimicrobiaceae bacterium]
MITKFAIEYTDSHRGNGCVRTHRTDDPIEAEDFLMKLLVSGAKIRAIKHEGIDLERPQFDRMLKIAGERLAAQLLRNSLGIDAAETKHRFGFAI